MSVLSNLKNKIPLLQAKGFKKYLLNTSWMMLEGLVRIVLSFFVGVYVARYLGPEKLGILSYSQSFVGLFLAIANLGLDEIIVRELVVNKEDQDTILGTAFLTKLSGAGVVFLVIIAITFFMDNSRETTICIILYAAYLLLLPIQVINCYFRSVVQSKYTVYVRFVQLSISSVIKVALVLTDSHLIWFVVVVIIEGLISMIGLIYVFHIKKGSLFKWRFSFALAKSLLSRSWLLVLSGLTVSIYMKIDQVMIKNLLNTEAVGYYAVAVKLTDIWYFIPGVITTSLFPSILKSKDFSSEHYQKRLQKLYDFMLWSAIGFALPVSFLANWIVYFIYGEQYSNAGAILSIYVWASVFYFVNTANEKWFLAEQLEWCIFIRSFLGAIVNVILNILLIDIYGVKGAALATICSIAFVAYFSLLLFKVSRGGFIMVTRSINIFGVFNRLRKGD